LISELFEINREIALALSRAISETQLRRLALASGMKTMIDDGLLKLDQTTLTEIIRVVPIEMIKEFASRDRKSPESSAARAQAMPPSYSENVHLLLSDPEKEAAVIDGLFERYQAMRKSIGQAPVPAEGGVFRQFMTQSYNQIAGKYNCKRVAFDFSVRDMAISITAKPFKEAS
jgi:hypothetical protein